MSHQYQLSSHYGVSDDEFDYMMEQQQLNVDDQPHVQQVLPVEGLGEQPEEQFHDVLEVVEPIIVKEMVQEMGDIELKTDLDHPQQNGVNSEVDLVRTDNEIVQQNVEEHPQEDTEHNREEVSTPTPTNTAKLTLSDLMAAESQYPIPYRSKLTEPFEPGQTLIVKGKTAEDSVRFTINLHHSSADFSGHDVPLHISVRFDEGKIVFNTFTKGEWGKEERKSNPYKKGDDIDFRIRAHDSKFTVFADQKEVKEYEHRVPLSHVTHFSIDGDVLITQVHWGGKYYPVPYESGITGEGFGPGKTLLIFGTPEKKGKRFHINLLKKNGDIALHLNPRFDEKAIVRNSLIANEWGNEEREGKIPLEKGIGFDLKVINEEYAFQIFINDERYATYAHRVEPHDLHGLQIGGDVEITGIQIF
uniref:Galectin n=1 Tax=Globodera rostochiensis TaxID=31243 RepID=A0A914HA34_GLORO